MLRVAVVSFVVGFVIAAEPSSSRAQQPATRPSPAQNEIYQPDPSPPARVVLPGRVTVPMLLEGGTPIVEVRIKDRPFRFGIETGAGFVAVTPKLVLTLGLQRTGGPDDSPSYLLDAVALGEARFEGVKVAALGTARPEVDGLLGLPFFAQVLLTLDYPGLHVSVERGSLPAPDGASVLPIEHAGPFWAVPMTLGDRRVQAIVDTRSTGAIGATPEAAASLQFDGELAVVGMARGAAIPETPVRAGRLAGDARLGRYVFPRPTINVRALPPGFLNEPIIGTRVLQQFAVTLDQEHRRIRFARDGSTTIELPVPVKRTVAVPAAPPGASGAAPPAARQPGAQAPATAGVAEADMRAFTGTYGDREITLRDGHLYLQRPGGPHLEMRATGPDTFGLVDVPAAQIEFVRDASKRVTQIRVLNPQGQWETVDRTK
jgi:hypothetical protein